MTFVRNARDKRHAFKVARNATHDRQMRKSRDREHSIRTKVMMVQGERVPGAKKDAGLKQNNKLKSHKATTRAIGGRLHRSIGSGKSP